MISTAKPPISSRPSKTSKLRSPFPSGRWGLVGLTILLWKGWSYWLLNRVQHPDEPLTVSALYRVGDIEYYPLIHAVGQGQWGSLRCGKN